MGKADTEGSSSMSNEYWMAQRYGGVKVLPGPGVWVRHRY